jgi:hypothetical protein
MHVQVLMERNHSLYFFDFNFNGFVLLPGDALSQDFLDLLVLTDFLQDFVGLAE